MSVGSYRLFVGNLAQTATQDEVERKFSPLVQVDQVELKQKKDAEGNIASAFAFVSVTTSQAGLNACLKQLDNSKWKGNLLTVQRAKESFLTRLQREREAEGRKPSDAAPSEVSTLAKRKVKHSPPPEDERPMRGNLPMFCGLASLEPDEPPAKMAKRSRSLGLELERALSQQFNSGCNGVKEVQNASKRKKKVDDQPEETLSAPKKKTHHKRKLSYSSSEESDSPKKTPKLENGDNAPTSDAQPEPTKQKSKYYVSDNLASLFKSQSQEEFSVSKLFGLEPSESTSEGLPVKNPFRHYNENDELTEDHVQESHYTSSVKPAVPVAFGDATQHSFFFQENDQRFSEAQSFYRKDPRDSRTDEQKEEDFKREREELKFIFRLKMKKSTKKKNPMVRLGKKKT